MSDILVKKQDVVHAIMNALNRVAARKNVTLNDIARAIDAELSTIEAVSDPMAQPDFMTEMQPKTVDDLLFHIENDF